jgi:hypothetical protein
MKPIQLSILRCRKGHWSAETRSCPICDRDEKIRRLEISVQTLRSLRNADGAALRKAVAVDMRKMKEERE